jgi:hypothetical protein
MSPALSRGLRKAGRSILQLVAGGGATALVDLIAKGLSPATSAVLLTVFTTVAAFLHNYFETTGAIPAILPTPGLVTTGPSTGVVGSVVGTVDAVTTGATQVTGDVVNTAGKVVGGVTGTVGGLLTDLTGVEDPGKGL